MRVFSSVEVAGATDVRVHDRRPVRGGGRPSAIEVGLQDRGNRGVGARANLERAAAGGFQSLMPEAVGVPEDADRGAEALLRMRLLSQDDLDQRRCLRPDLVRSTLVCTENLIRVDDVKKSPKLAE